MYREISLRYIIKSFKKETKWDQCMQHTDISMGGTLNAFAHLYTYDIYKCIDFIEGYIRNQ